MQHVRKYKLVKRENTKIRPKWHSSGRWDPNRSKSDVGGKGLGPPCGIYTGEQRRLSGRWFGEKHETVEEERWERWKLPCFTEWFANMTFGDTEVRWVPSVRVRGSAPETRERGGGGNARQQGLQRQLVARHPWSHPAQAWGSGMKSGKLGRQSRASNSTKEVSPVIKSTGKKKKNLAATVASVFA